MEGTRIPMDVSERREPSALRMTQVGLLVASLGAVLIIFHVFGLGVVGLFLAVGGAVMAAPGGFGKPWYWGVAGGAIVAVLSRLVADGAETTGGWLAVVGAIAILIGASLGYPVRNEREG
jgi:hypothetical protein